MNKFIKQVAFLVLIITAVTAEASSTTSFIRGNQLLDLCKSNNTVEQGVCEGYVMGVNDTMHSGFLDKIFQVCIPLGVSPTQLRSVVINYMQTVPHKLNFVADGVVAEALAVAFQCQELEVKR